MEDVVRIRTRKQSQKKFKQLIIQFKNVTLGVKKGFPVLDRQIPGIFAGGGWGGRVYSGEEAQQQWNGIP